MISVLSKVRVLALVVPGVMLLASLPVAAGAGVNAVAPAVTSASAEGHGPLRGGVDPARAGDDLATVDVTIQMDSPLAFHEMDLLAKVDGVETVELVTSVLDGNDELTVGTFLQPNSNASFQFAAGVREMLAQLDSSTSTASGADALIDQRLADTMRRALETQSLTVHRLRVQVRNQETLQRLRSLPRLAEAQVWARPLGPVATPSAEVARPDCEYYARFTPNTISHNTYSDIYRFASLQFTWTSVTVGNLHCWGSNTTYEHELVTNNYDGLHYFNRDGIRSWSSTLPNPYFDTNFDDSDQELNFAIGTYLAGNVRENRTYTNNFSTYVGNWSTDTAKITGQRGHRVPSGCYSPYCVFPLATQIIRPGWSVCIPGYNCVRL